MKYESYRLPGVFVVTPTIHRDHRGYFMETHRTADLADQLDAPGRISFVQANVSSSIPWTLRGLHYQVKDPQGKLMRVLKGSAFIVGLDLRANSPGFGEHVTIALDEQTAKAIWLPPGFAAGFLASAQGALVHYECSSYYAEKHARSIRWNDPELQIGWPLQQGQTPVLTDKDRAAPMLADAELPEGMEAAA